MSEIKDQQTPQSEQALKQEVTVSTESTQVQKEKSKLQIPKVKQQSLEKDVKKVDLKNRKLESKRLALVFYEIAKSKQSIFTEEQKYPIVASMGGLFMTLCSATIVNFGQSIFKVDEKKKRLFFIFGAANIFASLFLGGYSIYKISDMYMKVPEQQWDRIAKQKQSYDKLSFSQKKAFLVKDFNQEQKDLVQAVVKSQLLKNKQRVELTK